jgi:DNA repair protein RadC
VPPATGETMSTSDHPAVPTVQDRLTTVGARALTDAELLIALLGPTSGANSVSKAAMALLDAAPLAELAWATPEQLATVRGIGPARAAAPRCSSVFRAHADRPPLLRDTEERVIPATPDPSASSHECSSE